MCQNKHTKLVIIVYTIILFHSKNTCKAKKTPFFSFFFGIMLGSIKKSCTFASLLENQSLSGCSAVRLARLLWEQEVPGSNPGTPTKKLKYCKLTD